jgi:hypothetical protein
MNDKDSALSIRQQLEDFIKEIHTDYEIWYAKSVRRIYLVWYIFQILIAASTLLFAIISSIAVVLQNNNPIIKNQNTITIYMVILPALSSALANIIIRFRVYDLWMIRENARIAFQNLHNEGKWKLAKAKSEQDYIKLYAYLTQRVNDIENEQESKFFSISKQEMKQIKHDIKEAKKKK